jgi:hypothetical protein
MPSPEATVKRGRVTAEVSAGLLGSVGSAGFAAGVTLEPRLTVRGWPLGFIVGAMAQGTRTVDLGDGKVNFGRAALLLGVGYRFESGRFMLDLRAHALAGLVYLSGQGFKQNFDGADGDVGVGGGARASYSFGKQRPFIGIDAVGWLRSIQAQALEGGNSVTAEMPRFEVLIAVGLIFRKQ